MITRSNTMKVLLFALVGIFIHMTAHAMDDNRADAWTALEQAREEILQDRLSEAKETLAHLERLELTESEGGEKAFLEAEILWREGDREQAYQKYKQAKDMLPVDNFWKSEALWKMAEYHNARKEGIMAMHYGRQSVQLLPDSQTRNLQMAYLAMENNKDKEAAMYFERAVKAKQPDDDQMFVFMDMAYAYKRIGENEKVLDYLKRVIDVYTDKTGGQEPPVRRDVETLYNLRREHADITRKFGASSGIFYVRDENSDYAWQGLQELYWQPYYSNGRLVQVYGQMIGNFRTKGLGADGGDSVYGVLGVRAEPLAQYNLLLGLERVFKIGKETENNVRLRVAYSWDTGMELQPYVPNWQYATLFTEYIYAMETEYSLFHGKTRFGRSFRIDAINSRLAISPHAFASCDYNSRFFRGSDRWQAHAGVGIHFRQWYRENKYNAPRSYFDVFIEYRAGLTSRSNNGFVLMLVNYF